MFKKNYKCLLVLFFIMFDFCYTDKLLVYGSSGKGFKLIADDDEEQSTADNEQSTADKELKKAEKDLAKAKKKYEKALEKKDKLEKQLEEAQKEYDEALAKTKIKDEKDL